MQQKQWDESVRIVEEYAKKTSFKLPKGYVSKLQDVEPKNAIAFVNSLVEAPTKAPAAKVKAKPKGPKWDSADEIVDVIKGIVQGAPYVDVAGIGSKLQGITNQPWNKKFKPEFGALGPFIRRYSKEFYVDENDRVYIRSEWAAAERKKNGERAEANKAATGSSNTAKKSAAKKKSVKAKRRCSLCGCLDFSSPFLYLFMAIIYTTVCVMVLTKGGLHHSLVEWLAARHYVSRTNPNVISLLSAGDVIKEFTNRLLIAYQHYATQAIRWYSEFRRTNQTWRSLEEAFLSGLQSIWQVIVRAWDATIGSTQTGITLAHWTKVIQTSQAWQSITQNWERLIAK